MKCKSVFLVMFSLILAGCAENYSGNRYEGSAVGEIQRTDTGTVISLRKVEIKPETSGVGTALGAVAGGVAGSMFGGGNAKILTATAGAVAGGVAGNAIATRTQDGIEYTIRLDNGAVVTITQDPTPVISVGQKVRLIYSQKGRSRVVPE